MNNNRWQPFINEQTPFYLYDLTELRRTLKIATYWSNQYGYELHYALKANANAEILREMKNFGIGADCVSGNEIRQALRVGINPNQIVFAGVGKTDEELQLAIETGILCINVESIQELEVIQSLASRIKQQAPVALRVNPDIDPHTHEYISTGQSRNKFGIARHELLVAIEQVHQMPNLKFMGLHFHVGSQIRQMDVFVQLCHAVNRIQDDIENAGYTVPNLNLGGGLGVDYENQTPELPDFETYFGIFHSILDKRENQTVHFEPGRSLVASCGTLITKVLYVKPNPETPIAIVDAGMTELIRPALYQCSHPIENISNNTDKQYFTIAGPICESSDVFATKTRIARPQRNHLLAIKQVGAYGESMSSRYNMRPQVRHFYKKSQNHLLPQNTTKHEENAIAVSTATHEF